MIGMTARLWCLTYTHDGKSYALTAWGDADEIERHAERLGLIVEGECIHIEDAETGEIEYMTGGRH